MEQKLQEGLQKAQEALLERSLRRQQGDSSFVSTGSTSPPMFQHCPVQPDNKDHLLHHVDHVIYSGSTSPRAPFQPSPSQQGYGDQTPQCSANGDATHVGAGTCTPSQPFHQDAPREGAPRVWTQQIKQDASREGQSSCLALRQGQAQIIRAASSCSTVKLARMTSDGGPLIPHLTSQTYGSMCSPRNVEGPSAKVYVQAPHGLTQPGPPRIPRNSGAGTPGVVVESVVTQMPTSRNRCQSPCCPSPGTNTPSAPFHRPGAAVGAPVTTAVEPMATSGAGLWQWPAF